MGLSSILVPRSGEANFDTFVDNPLETAKQRREAREGEVRALLEKLQPENMMLDPNVLATVRQPKKNEKKTKKEIEDEIGDAVEAAKNTKVKNKTKGRSKPSKRAKRKEQVEYKETSGQTDKKRRISDKTELPKALQLFARNMRP